MSSYLNKIKSLIEGRENLVAILAPPGVVRSLANEIYANLQEDKKTYLEYLEEGGLIGYLEGYPLIIAPDSVLRVVSYDELIEYAAFVGVDIKAISLCEIRATDYGQGV